LLEKRRKVFNEGSFVDSNARIGYIIQVKEQRQDIGCSLDDEC
jgi:hypothetical protein